MKKVIVVTGTVFLAGLFFIILPCAARPSDYQYKETENVVNLVNDAARLIEKKGEASFPEFRIKGSAWRRENLYVFVLDTDGNMIVHPDPALEGKNQIGLEDVNGKSIAKGLSKIATGYKNKNEGWFHYQWPEPGNIFPEWKSVFARSVISPSGKKYIACCGLYDAQMEKGFAVELVDMAVEQIEKSGEAAFKDLRDPAGEFLSKDTYVFVIGPDGKDLVDPAFPNLEGTNLLNIKDARGKEAFRESILALFLKQFGRVRYYPNNLARIHLDSGRPFLGSASRIDTTAGQKPFIAEYGLFNIGRLHCRNVFTGFRPHVIHPTGTIGLDDLHHFPECFFSASIFDV